MTKLLRQALMILEKANVTLSHNYPQFLGKILWSDLVSGWPHVVFRDGRKTAYGDKPHAL